MQMQKNETMQSHVTQRENSSGFRSWSLYERWLFVWANNFCIYSFERKAISQGCCDLFLLTSGYKADRQNSPNGKHYLWPSSPFQRLGSVYCRLRSSPLYQRACEREHRRQIYSLDRTTNQKRQKNNQLGKKPIGRLMQCVNPAWHTLGIFC